MNRARRDTICVEDAVVLQHLAHPDGQFVLRLEAPECAARAVAGSFAHVRCAAELPMRRPLSIMRARPEEGWIDLLYTAAGQGLRRLTEARPGERVSIVGPIGRGFGAQPKDGTPVLIGGGVGIPPLVFLAEQLAADDAGFRPVAFFGSEIAFPFDLAVSALPLPGCPDGATTALRWLEEIGIPCRLATHAGFAGCYPGLVTDLARAWLRTLADDRLATVQVFSCGPEPMLKAVAQLAAEFGRPSQLCLEEFMACGVGGCAGCAVEVQTADGPAMKRVCVDGPVFPGESIYPHR
ncbi:MAG: dihydroorotate dehydrogenase electron transfer subunit [Gammaproteobacteria bacterium]